MVYQTAFRVNNDLFLLNPIFSPTLLHLKSPQHFHVLYSKTDTTVILPLYRSQSPLTDTRGPDSTIPTVACTDYVTHPATLPMPVTTPPAGTISSPYISCPASCDSSRKGEPGSSSRFIRSRTNNLPLDVCLNLAFSPPPCTICCTTD